MLARNPLVLWARSCSLCRRFELSSARHSFWECRKTSATHRLSVYVYMYIYIYTFIDTHVYKHIICIYVLDLCVYLHMYIYIYIYMLYMCLNNWNGGVEKGVLHNQIALCLQKNTVSNYLTYLALNTTQKATGRVSNWVSLSLSLSFGGGHLIGLESKPTGKQRGPFFCPSPSLFFDLHFCEGRPNRFGVEKQGPRPNSGSAAKNVGVAQVQRPSRS